MPLVRKFHTHKNHSLEGSQEINDHDDVLWL